jgi:diacylglycerol kinase family enzyme
MTGRIITRAYGCFYKLFFRSKYKVAAFREVMANRSDYFRVEVDGKLLGDNIMCKSIGVNNIQRVGMHYRTTPYAQIDDGLMEFGMCHTNTLGELVDLLE